MTLVIIHLSRYPESTQRWTAHTRRINCTLQIYTVHRRLQNTWTLQLSLVTSNNHTLNRPGDVEHTQRRVCTIFHSERLRKHNIFWNFLKRFPYTYLYQLAAQFYMHSYISRPWRLYFISLIINNQVQHPPTSARGSHIFQQIRELSQLVYFRITRTTHRGDGIVRYYHKKFFSVCSKIYRLWI